MMYNNKLVAVIKVNGKALRERGETVYIPFGSEYSISFKNLNSVEAVVDVTIDGENVLDDSRLVIRANGENSIEGFMRGSNVSHKFKFIEKTDEISDYRGDNISDGLIRISFQFVKPVDLRSTWYSSITIDPYLQKYGNYTGNPDITRAIYSSSVEIPSSHSINTSTPDPNINTDDGITVKGSESNQSFVTTSVGALESQEHVVVFQLKGVSITGQVIHEPILVKTKIRCETCGKLSVPKHKFCGNCGTSIVI